MINNLHQKVIEAVSCKLPLVIELENEKIMGKIVGLGKQKAPYGAIEKVAVVLASKNKEELLNDSSNEKGEIMDIPYERMRSLKYLHRG